MGFYIEVQELEHYGCCRVAVDDVDTVQVIGVGLWVVGGTDDTSLTVKITTATCQKHTINSLVRGNFKYFIFKRILVIDGWGISCEIALIWISVDFSDDQSILA